VRKITINIIALTIGYGLHSSYGAALPLPQEPRSCLDQETQEEATFLAACDPKHLEKHTSPLKQGLERAELRAGLLKQDVKSKLQHGYEQGLAVIGEYLWQSPDHALFKGMLSPRPHLGATFNTRGSTSAAYAGLSWSFPKTSWGFIEVSFGGALHNGRLKRNKVKRKGYGSRMLFRESVSLGLLLKECHTVAVILDHMSNARLARPNPGLTNFGLRYGYVF
jgi:Lipid A 3-O-deacylase (PagL).